MNVTPVEDVKDVGASGFLNIDIERDGPWCQFDTYRVDDTGWYEFTTTRDGCESDDV